jgi:hypothetical protein
MGYRLSVKATIVEESPTLDNIESVLQQREIEYQREKEQVIIDYFDRNMNPGDRRVKKALSELSHLLNPPQSVLLWDEFEGETEVMVGCGRVRAEITENVWSRKDNVPTPEQILTGLRHRGLSARLTKVKGRRGGARQYEFQPSSGGPSCRVTVKRRFWDSYDLLAVPDVTDKLCKRYTLESDQLRSALYGSAFGMEVRNPARGGDNTDQLYENLLDVIEEITTGIRTTVG